MKTSELTKLRKLYKLEYERLNKISELSKENKVNEFIKLTNIDIDKLIDIDDNKIIDNILKNINITNTNNIYVCTKQCSCTSDWCDPETNYYIVNVPFDSKYFEFRYYQNIETLKYVIAYSKPEFIDYRIKNAYLTSNFEDSHIVLNPYNTYENNNGFDEVRKEFLTNCINMSQEKAKKLILDKYKRI